jgi:peptidoglycan/xylan/chitin deacetylase (PgdA/CDA1 family)
METAFVTADVLALSADDAGCYARVKVTFGGSKTVIRWGLDEFTYLNLQQCLDSFHRAEWSTVSGTAEDEGGRALRLGFSRKTDASVDRYTISGFFLGTLQEVTFLCSSVFASNLNWLYQIRSIHDLDELCIDDSCIEGSSSGGSCIEKSFMDGSFIDNALTDVCSPDGVSVVALRDAKVSANTAAWRLSNSSEVALCSDAVELLARGRRKGSKARTKSSVYQRRRRVAMQYSVMVATLLLVTAGYAKVPEYVTRLSAENLRPASIPGISTTATADAANTASATNHLANVPASAKSTSSVTTSRTAPYKSGLERKVSDVAPIALKEQKAPQVWEVPPGEVALTIDDGPSPLTNDFVKTLQRYGVHATFFFVGHQVAYWPESVRLAAAAGDEIGDHSMTHPDLATLSPAKQAYQILNDRALLEGLTHQPVQLFRPPYGAHSSVTDGILIAHHMSLALWNRDPRDWAAKTPQQIVHAVLSSHPSGGVYDLHEKDITLAALPAIIEGLQAMHLKFVTLPSGVQLGKAGQPVYVQPTEVHPTLGNSPG